MFGIKSTEIKSALEKILLGKINIMNLLINLEPIHGEFTILVMNVFLKL